jgi:sulfite reductase (NADPH) flavoprotein alpha-component
MLRKTLFQLHWLVGITIGAFLSFSGLTGGMMAFGPELTNYFSGAYEKVEVLPSGHLDAAALYAKIKAARPDQNVAKLTIYDEPGRLAKVTYSTPSGPMGPMSARAEMQNVNPYTGELLPIKPAGRAVNVFMMWLRDVHQGHWSGPGTVTDIAATFIGLGAVLLLGMAITGLYMRWPRGRVADWKAWLKIHTKLKGRAFLWNLHAVFGTCAFVIYLIIAHSGAYQNGEMRWYGNAARSIFGVPLLAERRPPLNAAAAGMGAGAPGQGPAGAMPPPGGGGGPMMGPPGGEGPGGGLGMMMGGSRGISVVYMGKDSYIDADTDDVNARTETLDPTTGALTPRKEQSAAATVGQKLDRNNQVIHEGRIFGPVGSFLFMLAGFSMPVFYVTGWMMYLKRRKRKQRVQQAGAVA